MARIKAVCCVVVVFATLVAVVTGQDSVCPWPGGFPMSPDEQLFLAAQAALRRPDYV